MDSIRKIARLVQGHDAIDGAGVRLVRVVGHNDVKDFDPFLLLDAFDSTKPADYIKGFPWHPHRGIETVTYLIHGRIDHGDSLGNSGSILDGDCQWMTAGGGIIHQEMPQPSERLLGLQLWINLPARHKMTQPAYRDLTADKIPLIKDGAADIRLVCGSHLGTQGPFQGEYVPALFMDIALLADASWSCAVQPDYTVFLYLLAGSCSVDGSAAVPERSAILLGKGERVELSAGPRQDLRCIMVAGPPLGEPIAWGGPIVMNSREELEQAFRELDDGSFIRS